MFIGGAEWIIITLCILLLFVIKKGGRNMLGIFGIKSQGSMILLKELRFNTDDNSKVRIKGEKVGFLQWILSKIGLHILFLLRKIESQ